MAEEIPMEYRGQNFIGTFKKMCRLLEVRRRSFIDEDWKSNSGGISQKQFLHLMGIRFSLPCNLSRIMELTGMTSAGASLFVDKLVKSGVLLRVDDPADRRNVIITLSPSGENMLKSIEDRLNGYICGFFDGCTTEELAILEQASQIVCRTLDKKA